MACPDCGSAGAHDPDCRWAPANGRCAECDGPLAEYEIERGYAFCGWCRGIDEDMLPGRIGR